MTQHLGELAAALVDGELDHDARDRALAHIALCSECREEVEAQRRTKGLVGRMPSPVMPQRLTESLQSLPALAGGISLHRVRFIRRARRWSLPHGTARRISTGVSTALAAGVAVAIAIGGAQRPGPTVRPPVDRFTVEHVVTTGEVPLTDSVAGAAVSFTQPSASPTP